MEHSLPILEGVEIPLDFHDFGGTFGPALEVGAVGGGGDFGLVGGDFLLPEQVDEV